jgi:hypothetical protein
LKLNGRVGGSGKFFSDLLKSPSPALNTESGSGLTNNFPKTVEITGTGTVSVFKKATDV